MCEHHEHRPDWVREDGSVDFADLDEAPVAGAEPTIRPMTPEQQTNYREYGATDSRSEVARFPCRACGGSGKFRSWSGRVVGDCFKCRGTGRTKTDPAKLEARRAAAAAKKAREAGQRSDDAKKFLEARPDIRAWLRRGEDRGNGFAMSLQDSLFKYGAWTPNQLAAVERAVARDAEYDAEVARIKAERIAAAASYVPDPNALDITKLPSGMYAVPGGDTRLKIRVSRPKDTSKWAGFIFVDDGAEYGSRQKYGRQAPGKSYTGMVQDQLRAILADPMAASAAYGRLVGACGVCGRKLEDEESVARGIGPICAGKFGG